MAEGDGNVYVCMNVCMYARMYICVDMYVYVCMYVCIWMLYTNIVFRKYACMYVCMCVCMNIYMYMHVWMYIVCMYECMYICMVCIYCIMELGAIRSANAFLGLVFDRLEVLFGMKERYLFLGGMSGS